jgi:hypothetical protein
MTVMTVAVISTGTRVDTRPESELELLGSLRAVPILGSSFSF